MVTVSRSVDRVFQVLELFTERRRPMSATEISQSLQIPHSSAVSVLTRLAALGYLDFATRTKRYFPSSQLQRLCQAVPEGVCHGSPLADLAQAIAVRTQETTSIWRLEGLFARPIHVHAAQHPQAHRVVAGECGGLAILSVVGRTLLATLPPDEAGPFIERSLRWAQRTRCATPPAPDAIRRSVALARAQGWLSGFDVLLQGVGAVACPLPATPQAPRFVVAVAGASGRLERSGQRVIGVLLREVQRLQLAAPQPAERLAEAEAERRSARFRAVPAAGRAAAARAAPLCE